MGFVLPQNAVALPSPKPDDSVVVLRGIPIAIASDIGAAFVSDASRNKERLLSDQRLVEKWELTLAGLGGDRQKFRVPPRRRRRTRAARLQWRCSSRERRPAFF